MLLILFCAAHHDRTRWFSVGSRKPLLGNARQRGATVLSSGQQTFTMHVFIFGFWKKKRRIWNLVDINSRVIIHMEYLVSNSLVLNPGLFPAIGLSVRLPFISRLYLAPFIPQTVGYACLSSVHYLWLVWEPGIPEFLASSYSEEF